MSLEDFFLAAEDIARGLCDAKEENSTGEEAMARVRKRIDAAETNAVNDGSGVDAAIALAADALLAKRSRCLAQQDSGPARAASINELLQEKKKAKERKTDLSFSSFVVFFSFLRNKEIISSPLTLSFAAHSLNRRERERELPQLFPLLPLHPHFQLRIQPWRPSTSSCSRPSPRRPSSSSSARAKEEARLPPRRRSRETFSRSETTTSSSTR